MGSYNFASYVEAKDPTLRGTDELGKLYGLTYDQGAIESILNRGTDAQYKVKQNELTRAENTFAISQFDNRNSAIEMLRANRSNQIASGASRGIQAASEAGTVMGLQRESVKGATDLSAQRIAVADEIGAAYAKNAYTAFSEANSVKQALAGISSSLYGSDMLGYTGKLNYNSVLDTNTSNRYSADTTAQATRDAASISANATLKAAQMSAAATKYASSAGAATTDTSGKEIDFANVYNKYKNNKSAFISYISGVTGGMSQDMVNVYGNMFDSFASNAKVPSAATKPQTTINLNRTTAAQATQYFNKK